MAPKELNFITGNKNKLAEVQAILSETPVKLQSQAVDLVEIQGTIEEISTDKAKRAAEAVCCSCSAFLWSRLVVTPDDCKIYTGYRLLTDLALRNNRSRDRFWLKIRACVSMLSMSYLGLTCTFYLQKTPSASCTEADFAMNVKEVVPPIARCEAIPQTARGLRGQVCSGCVHFRLLRRSRSRAHCFPRKDSRELHCK